MQQDLAYSLQLPPSLILYKNYLSEEIVCNDDVNLIENIRKFIYNNYLPDVFELN